MQKRLPDAEVLQEAVNLNDRYAEKSTRESDRSSIQSCMVMWTDAHARRGGCRGRSSALAVTWRPGEPGISERVSVLHRRVARREVLFKPRSPAARLPNRIAAVLFCGGLQRSKAPRQARRIEHKMSAGHRHAASAQAAVYMRQTACPLPDTALCVGWVRGAPQAQRTRRHWRTRGTL